MTAERRESPRLELAYPIRVHRSDAASPEGGILGNTVTRNLSSRGTYFTTFERGAFAVGQEVAVVISVPHRPAKGGPDLLLDLRGKGRVVRVDGPRAHRRFQEDGLCLSGVAVAFEDALSFRYGWV